MSLLLRSAWSALLLLILCSPLLAGEEGGRVYYDAGVFAYQEGDYAGAERYFRQALTLQPKNPDYNQYLGKTYLATKRYDDAAPFLETAWRVDPQLPGLRYDLATLHFKMADYPEAARLYAEVLSNDPSDVLARYYLGISHLKLEAYESALEDLLLAAQQSPTIRENGYYYAGICFFKLERLDEAKEKFVLVRDNATNTNLRDNAEKYLAAIDRRQQESMKPYALYLRLGYMSDSDVLLEDLGRERPTGKSDDAVMGYFSGRYDFFKTETWTLGGGYSHYYLDYDRYSEFDLTASLPQIYIQKRISPLTLSLTYSPNYYWLGEDDYLMKHEIRPEILWRVSPRLSARLAYTHEIKNYFVTTDLSGHAHKIDADLFYALPDGRFQVYGGCGQEWNSADVDAQDYRRTQVRLGGLVSLPWSLRLHLMGKYTFKEYSSPNPAFNDLQREDETLEALCSISRSLFYDWLRAMVEYRFTRNDSNIAFNQIDVFDYDRHQVTVSLAVSF